MPTEPITTRFLTYSDLEILNHRIQENYKLWKLDMQIEFKNSLIGLLSLYLKQEEGRRLFGSFEGNSLIAILGISLLSGSERSVKS